MSDPNYSLIHQPKQAIASASVIQLLDSIRPLWKTKTLIQRVIALLEVDPSSACQRLFNAGIHDLKQKLLVMGVDLVSEVAKNYRLPPITGEDDIIDYNVSKTIDLSYRTGILSRSEWRRIKRCYEIRRDLEHEDNEYEAVPEDCFYIFKSTIEIILSKDPIHVLRINDVKDIVENSTGILLSEEFSEDYKCAPVLRQKEIVQYLVSISLNPKQPDVVRENCVEMMRYIKEHTRPEVVIDAAKTLEEKLARNTIDLATAKVGHAIGATGYLKRTKLIRYYSSILEELKKASSSWNRQAKIMELVEDIGGLTYCPDDVYYDLLRELVLIYLGEQSYGQYQHSRKVFFSNVAAPIVYRVLENEKNKIAPHLEQMKTKSKKIKSLIEYVPILRRFEELLDIIPIDDQE